MDAPETQLLLPNVIARCREQSRSQKLSDSTGSSLNGGAVLSRAMALRRVLRRYYLDESETNVGIIMPPTVAGAVANLALALDRRVPVNLNFVLSPEALEYSIQEAGIDHIITSEKVLDRLGLELETPTIILEEIPPLVGPLDMATAAFQGMVMPQSQLIRHLGLNKTQPDDLFTLLFTSGSTGVPKGVMLSHRNIASNCAAIQDHLSIRPDDVLIGVLPFFHAFGLTVTLWMPLVSHASAAYHTSPLETDAIAKLTREQRGTLMVSTPTLLRQYVSRISSEDFTSINMIATGAERLPTELADACERKFDVRPFEGYGVTEASPAIAFNVPEDRWSGSGPAPIREGTIGKSIPGVNVRVTDRDTGEMLGPGAEGYLSVKGPNVMLGYLNQPDRTVAALQDGWFNTRDVVRIDEEGFITITGRASQFSKIGGEMVPHLLIEESISKVITSGDDGENHVAVTAVPHKRKGERVVVVHTPIAETPNEINHRLHDAGLPTLFIPSEDSYVEVEELPLLGFGKVDLAALKLVAQTAFDNDGGRLHPAGREQRLD